MKGYSTILLALALAVSTLPIGSTSVVCTAPGGHMAIEDVDAGCCGHIAIFVPASSGQNRSFGSSGDCENCVDLLLCSNSQGAFSRSVCSVPYLAEVFVGHLIPATFYSSGFDGDVQTTRSSAATRSVLPLRC
jgi:hypothetical protein